MKRVILISFLLHITSIFCAENVEQNQLEQLPTEIKTQITQILSSSGTLEQAVQNVKKFRASCKANKDIIDAETAKLIQILATTFNQRPYMVALLLGTEEAMNEFEEYLKKSNEPEQEIIIQKAISKFSSLDGLKNIFQRVAKSLDMFSVNETSLFLNRGVSVRWIDDKRKFIKKDSLGMNTIQLPAQEKGSFYGLGEIFQNKLVLALFTTPIRDKDELLFSIYMLDLIKNEISIVITLYLEKMAKAQLHPYRISATPEYAFVYGSFTLNNTNYWQIIRLKGKNFENVFVTKELND